MPRPIKKRLEKKGQEKGDIRETVEDIKEVLRKRQRNLIYLFSASIVIVILIIGFVVYSKTTASKASELEFEGYKLYYGDNLIIPLSNEERYRKALDMFSKAYKTRKRPYPLLYMANCHYELGNYDDAIKLLSDLNNQFSDPNIISLSYYKMAMAYMKKGDMEKALEALKNIYTIKGSTLNDIALFESGRILEKMDKKQEAKERFKELVDRFPKSQLLDEAKKRLEVK